jgi:hypothetical protein
MGGTVQANDGTMLPLDSLAESFIYDGDFLSTITVQYQGNSYIQTFINDGTDIIYISNWMNPDYPSGGQIMQDEDGSTLFTEDGNVILTEY